MKRIIKAGFMMLLGAAIWMNGGDVKEAKAQECAAGGSVLHLEGYSVCNYIGGNCIQHPPGQIPPICQPQPQRSTNTRSVPPKPSSYGAVAWDPEASLLGRATGKSTKQAAIDAALSACGGSGCKVATWYANQCVAAGYGQLKGGYYQWFASSGLNQNDAETYLLANCGKKAKNCQVSFSECSLP